MQKFDAAERATAYSAMVMKIATVEAPRRQCNNSKVVVESSLMNENM